MPARRYLRRSVGVLCAATPAAWCLTLLVVAVRGGGRSSMIGLVTALLGAAIVVLNVLLGVIRPLLHLRRHGSRDGYRHISGYPFAATLFAMIGGAIGFGSALVAAIALAVVLLDTGGPAAFVMATWRETSL